MATPTTILVADDEPNLRRVLSGILTRAGYEVLEAADGEEALGLLGRGVSAVVTDLRMPRIDGMTVLRHVVSEAPDVPVIILTAHGTVDSAVEAVKLGAFDYIEKPFEKEQIRQIVAKAVRHAEAAKKSPRVAVASVTDKVPGKFGFVGDSPGMIKIYDIISKIADTPSTVMVTGESGTGKELVARALHHNSARKKGPFIKINCAAIPNNLVESELFGYEQGAFTGAVGSKPGRMELAHQGTLFLDEIGEIPSEMQVKLLRALQESEFERVGGIKTIKVDVRVVTATNRDLEEQIKQGKFREDLYYRLNVVPLAIPPLRERVQDIPALVQHIIGKFKLRLKKKTTGIEDDALTVLCAYGWPGNIRELENVLERTILFSDAEKISLDDLPEEIRLAKSQPPISVSRSGAKGQHSLKDLVRAETLRVEREYIVQALAETEGNVTQAAKRLKISRKSLQLKMKDLGLRE